MILGKEIIDMNITVNEKILTAIFNEAESNDDLIEFLNLVIDNELNQYEPNCDLIDECVNTILELKGERDFQEIHSVKLSPKKIIKIVNSKDNPWKKLSVTFRVAIIAAVIATSTITVNAAVKAVTSKHLFEQIGVVETVEENTTEVKTTTEKAVKKETTQITTIPKKDDSYLFSKVENNNEMPVIKNIQYCGDYTHGKKINYTKIGNSLKTTITFIEDDDFDETNYLIGEYGPVGAFYCDSEDGSRIEHSFTDWTETKASTCAERGEKVRTCTLCNRKQICPTPKKSEHICSIDKSMQNTPSTDNQHGIYYYKCKECSAIFERNQPRPEKIVLSNDLFYYNGKTQRPKVIAVLDENGYEIPKSEYTVSFSHQESIGVYSEYAVCIHFNSEYYSGNIQTVYFIYPPNIQIDGITSLENSLNVYWNANAIIKENNTTGYEIQYSQNSDFSKSKKIIVDELDETSTLIKSLSSNTTYYIRMRTYCDDEFQLKKINSQWSDVRAVVVK